MFTFKSINRIPPATDKGISGTQLSGKVMPSGLLRKKSPLSFESATLVKVVFFSVNLALPIHASIVGV